MRRALDADDLRRTASVSYSFRTWSLPVRRAIWDSPHGLWEGVAAEGYMGTLAMERHTTRVLPRRADDDDRKKPTAQHLNEKYSPRTFPPFAKSLSPAPVYGRVLAGAYVQPWHEPQIAHMVRSSTPRSLLLIDEFGKGTAPADGIGLVAALLRHLSRAGRKCLFTLHFHEIFRLRALLLPPLLWVVARALVGGCLEAEAVPIFRGAGADKRRATH